MEKEVLQKLQKAEQEECEVQAGEEKKNLTKQEEQPEEEQKKTEEEQEEHAEPLEEKPSGETEKTEEREEKLGEEAKKPEQREEKQSEESKESDRIEQSDLALKEMLERERKANEQMLYAMQQKIEQQGKELEGVKREKRRLTLELSEIREEWGYPQEPDSEENWEKREQKRRRKASVKMFPVFSVWGVCILMLLTVLNLSIPKEYYGERAIWFAFLAMFVSVMVIIANDLMTKKVIERTLVYFTLELWFVYGVFCLLNFTGGLGRRMFGNDILVFSPVIWLILLLALRAKPLEKRSTNGDQMLLHGFLATVLVWYSMHIATIIRMMLNAAWSVQILGCLYLVSAVFVIQHLFALLYIKKEYLAEAVQNGRRRLKMLTYIFFGYHVLFSVLYIVVNILL
ncbi:MAG: hypothetical protein Q4E24_04905 [bacterium]|nr:hypothetical protein [bacterium]